MIRILGTFLLLGIMSGGYMFYDFKMSARLAGGDGAESLTFPEYLSGLSGRIAGLTGAASASGLPTKLADMLPRPPEGWKVRAVAADDVQAFLPKSSDKADSTAVKVLEEMVSADAGEGTETATLAYEKGDRTLLIRAVRYPNQIFTGPTALQQRQDLQERSAQFRGTEFMTVRGLDVTEDLLPEGFRGRLFLADVGAQIHLRVLAPKRMKDAELLTFFETLHVEAMNASVIDKVEGLGKVPVIVLVSALEDADREIYLSDRAAREADKASREEAGRIAAVAEESAEVATTSGDVSILAALQQAILGGGEPEAAEVNPELSEEERKAHQAALLEAAKSGDSAAAAAHSAALYGAIAEELGKTEMKSASGTARPSGGANTAKIEVGVGSCKTEGGRKICAVGGASD
ncbi:MAG: hypothetical protein ACKO2N_12440 [Tabrizicola sp.]